MFTARREIKYLTNKVLVLPLHLIPTHHRGTSKESLSSVLHLIFLIRVIRFRAAYLSDIIADIATNHSLILTGLVWLVLNLESSIARF